MPRRKGKKKRFFHLNGKPLIFMDIKCQKNLLFLQIIRGYVIIEAIHLHNFQAHKDLRITLSESVTCIRGESDIGKSSVLRALRWCCLNDFSGDDFISWGEKECSATLKVQTKAPHTVIRSKSKSLNTYELDGEEFKSFGKSGVPETISRILNLSEINFQSQHDAAFWLSESAPEVSRQLNAVIDLSIIDTSLCNVAAVVRKATDKVEVIKERLNDWKKKYAELEPQKRRVADFKNLEKLNNEREQADKDHGDLHDLLHRIHSNQAGLLQDKYSCLEQVFSKARECRYLQEDISALQSILGRLSEFKKAKEPPPFDSVEKAREAYLRALDSHQHLEKLLRDFYRADAKRIQTIEDKHTTLRRFESESKGQICPLCERKI